MAGFVIDNDTQEIKVGSGGIKLDPGASDIVTVNNGLLLPDGSATTPALRFASDGASQDTGLYQISDEHVTVAGQGQPVVDFIGAANTDSNYLKITNAISGSDVSIAIDGADDNATLTITGKGTGTVKINGMSFPTGTGVSGQFLKTNADGTLAWGDAVGALTALSDVNISSPSDGEFLRYNSGTSKWTNQTYTPSVALDDITDVTITTASNNQVLLYNGSGWVNSDAPSSDPTGYAYSGTITTPPSASGEDVIVIGDGCKANTNGSVCIGLNNDARSVSGGASGNYAVVIGYNSGTANITNTQMLGGVWVGENVKNGTNRAPSQPLMIGKDIVSNAGTTPILIGRTITGSTSSSSSDYNMVIGWSNNVNSNSGSPRINIGYANNAQGSNTVVVGHNASGLGGFCTAVGPNVSVGTSANYSTAVGYLSSISASVTYGLAVGWTATVAANYGCAIGNSSQAGAYVDTGANNSFALGGARARSYGEYGWSPYSNTHQNSKWLLTGNSANGATVNLTTSGGGDTNRLTITSGWAYFFNVMICGTDTTNDQIGWWKYRGVAKNAGTLTILDLTLESSFLEDNTWGTPAITADTTNNAIQTACAGITGKTVHFKAYYDGVRTSI